MAKNLSAIQMLYNDRIKILEAREKEVLASMTPDAQKAMQELLSLTSDEAQNKQIEEAITKIESLLTLEYVQEHSSNAAQIQQEIAKEILRLDNELQILGTNNGLSGLEHLANGNYGAAITPASGGVTLVDNKDLNDWLVKIMKRIAAIKQDDKKNFKKGFTGYLSNLKGEYLEQAVLKTLGQYLPVDVLVQGGTMRAGSKGGRGRQIEEDIFLVYNDGGKAALQEVLNNNSYRTKKGRISIDVPTYEKIQSGAAGISVKAGSTPIKFYEGNLDAFFNAGQGDIDVDSYRANVLKRGITGYKDSDEGALMNRYVTALRLDIAVGSNNLFLATRNKMLTTMSKELALIKDNGMLSMYYNIKANAANKAKQGATIKSTITGRIVSPKT